MANNYTQETGSLVLNIVTPVIEALFGVFEVRLASSGNAYIVREDSSCVTYEDVMESICSVMEIPPESVDTFEASVLAMASELDKFDEVSSLVSDEFFDLEEDADLELLFRLARVMDDGHGLTSLWMEGAFTCDKMRQGEFGGFGEFSGSHFSASSSSGAVRFFGSDIDSALEEKDFDKTADRFLDRIHNMFNGIRDEAARASVIVLVTKKLQAQS